VLLAAPHGPVLRLLTLLGVPGVHASVAAALILADGATLLLLDGLRQVSRVMRNLPLYRAARGQISRVKSARRPPNAR
jgi:hypothetical protein